MIRTRKRKREATGVLCRLAKIYLKHEVGAFTVDGHVVVHEQSVCWLLLL